MGRSPLPTHPIHSLPRASFSYKLAFPLIEVMGHHGSLLPAHLLTPRTLGQPHVGHDRSAPSKTSLSTNHQPSISQTCINRCSPITYYYISHESSLPTIHKPISGCYQPHDHDPRGLRPQALLALPAFLQGFVFEFVSGLSKLTLDGRAGPPG